ncbi:cupin domain-containing protein [Erythrobacter aureus]|uniref:Cupin domain-containing protein n=1 Tax=Erythrobacter aureus TaxID=2182384 RepID=A0A345YBJ7_9SPHN|nr:cupin domain-containing protein [Erythrobacter aureus]AXK41299.1 cupin domain-containing protein [Erythrobacter aureus]
MSSSTNDPAGLAGKLAATSRARFSGIDAKILLGGEKATSTVMAMSVAPGMGSPAHISHDESKIFHVTAGDLVFLVGEEKMNVTVGDTIHVPKGFVHSFVTVGSEDAAMLLVATPSGHDRFFTALADLEVPHDQDEVAQVCSTYNQTIVGPPVAP